MLTLNHVWSHQIIISHWTRVKTKKHLATAKELIRKNSACCLKIRQFFHRANVQIGLTPPVRFSLLFNDPLPPLHDERTFWMSPYSNYKWRNITKQCRRWHRKWRQRYLLARGWQSQHFLHICRRHWSRRRLILIDLYIVLDILWLNVFLRVIIQWYDEMKCKNRFLAKIKKLFSFSWNLCQKDKKFIYGFGFFFSSWWIHVNEFLWNTKNFANSVIRENWLPRKFVK